MRAQRMNMSGPINPARIATIMMRTTTMQRIIGLLRAPAIEPRQNRYNDVNTSMSFVDVVLAPISIMPVL